MEQFLIRAPLLDIRPVSHLRCIPLVQQCPRLFQPLASLQEEEPACFSSPSLTVHLSHVQISALNSSAIHLLSLSRLQPWPSTPAPPSSQDFPNTHS